MADDSRWHTGAVQFPPGPDPDGSASLLRLLDGLPQTYQQWAEEYYEVEVSVKAVEQMYRHHPLTAALDAELNAKITLDDLAEDAAEIGYPTGVERPIV